MTSGMDHLGSLVTRLHTGCVTSAQLLELSELWAPCVYGREEEKEGHVRQRVSVESQQAAAAITPPISSSHGVRCRPSRGDGDVNSFLAPLHLTLSFKF